MTHNHAGPLSVLALLSAAGDEPNLPASAPSSSTYDSGSDDTVCSSGEEQNDLDEADCTEQKGQSRTEVTAADDSESQCGAAEGPQKASKDDMQGKKRPRDDDAQDGPGRRRVQWKKYGEKVLKRKSAVDANNVVYRYYYRCNYPGCTARKVLEKCFDENKRCKNMSSKVNGTHSHADEMFRYKKCYDEHECEEDEMISVTPNQPGHIPAASQPLMQLLAMNQMNANALSKASGLSGNMNMNWNAVMLLGMRAGMEMVMKMSQQQQIATSNQSSQLSNSIF